MTRVSDVEPSVVTAMGERFWPLDQPVRLTHDGRHAR